MKILHICNTAGVGSVIAKYMDRLFGTESLVVDRRVFDPAGLMTYGELWDNGAKTFTLRCLLKARRFDIVHIHYFDKIIPYLRLFYPKKRVVLHYHGSDIRGKWILKRKYWSKANRVLFSSLDLLDNETPKQATFMPNPVDTKIFHPCKVKPKPKTAFHFFYNANDLAEKYAKKHGLELTIYDLKNEARVPHLKLPEMLCRYEYYIDVKRMEGKLLKVPLSKTALEALACGLKVVKWNSKIIENFPSENRPENVAEKTFTIYQALLKA